MTVKELIERLEKADPDVEVILITPWGYPTSLEQIYVDEDCVTLSGHSDFDKHSG